MNSTVSERQLIRENEIEVKGFTRRRGVEKLWRTEDIRESRFKTTRKLDQFFDGEKCFR